MSRSDMSEVVRASTVVELLEQSQSTIVDEAGIEMSVADILDGGRLLAADLLGAGYRPGDRIAVQMQNGPLYLKLLAAAAVGRFVLVSVNTRFESALAESIIGRSGSKTVIRSAQDLPAADDQRADCDSVQPDDRYVVFTTSGTTSAPKLVVHQQRSVSVHAGDVAAALGYDRDAVVMVPLPLCGVFGFSALWGALAGHSRVVLPAVFDAEESGRLIEQHGVTSLHGSDDLFHRLLATNWDLSTLGCCGYGRFNSALDGIVERCEARSVPLSGVYGMSEVHALYAFRGTSDLPREQRWQAGGGLVSPSAACRVVDGELQLRGPSMFEGYLADGGDDINHTLTVSAFDGQWFKTGDLAAADGDRSFEYITRMGDVMRLGGFLVAPAEVEESILQLDQIDQAQVVAVGREEGARPVAFVILAADAWLDEQAVIEHCAATLARFKCPVRVAALDEFPVTDGPNGVKIQRAKLRELGLDLLQS